jgi:hypothetical protein
MKPEVKKKIEKCTRLGICLTCGEPLGDRVVRGVHDACAKTTYRAIRNGLTTDEERVEAGKWLPRSRSGRPPSNPIIVELLGAKRLASASKK